jgi:hypothetical protein
MKLPQLVTDALAALGVRVEVETEVGAVIELSGRAIAVIHRALFLDDPCPNDEGGMEVWGDNAELYAGFTDLMNALEIEPLTHINGQRFYPSCACDEESH